jgi:hypothetical protein
MYTLHRSVAPQRLQHSERVLFLFRIISGFSRDLLVLFCVRTGQFKGAPRTISDVTRLSTDWAECVVNDSCRLM